MGFIKTFKDALAGELGEFYSVQEIEVVCPHCGSERFELSDAQLNTAGLTFLGFDWANKSASVLACVNCGCLQWFLTKPEEREAPQN